MILGLGKYHRAKAATAVERDFILGRQRIEDSEQLQFGGAIVPLSVALEDIKEVVHGLSS